MFKTITSCALAITLAGVAMAEPPTTPAPETHLPTMCDVADVTIYFAPQATELGDVAETILERAAEDLAGCTILSMEATATAADASSADEMVTLANARTMAVLDRLVYEGVRAIDVSEAINPEPLRADQDPAFVVPLVRRVDVSFTAAPAVSS